MKRISNENVEENEKWEEENVLDVEPLESKVFESN